MAETIGPTNTTQVLDVQANSNNIFTPAYAVYEHGTLVRALLMNYASDPSGASDIYVDLGTVAGGTPLPSSVQVKYTHIYLPRADAALTERFDIGTFSPPASPRRAITHGRGRRSGRISLRTGAPRGRRACRPSHARRRRARACARCECPRRARRSCF